MLLEIGLKSCMLLLEEKKKFEFCSCSETSHNNKIKDGGVTDPADERSKHAKIQVMAQAHHHGL